MDKIDDDKKVVQLSKFKVIKNKVKKKLGLIQPTMTIDIVTFIRQYALSPMYRGWIATWPELDMVKWEISDDKQYITLMLFKEEDE